MLAHDVTEAFAAINASLDTVAKLDLSELDPADLLHLAALTEKTIRRHTVVSHDVSHQLGQRTVGEIGGSAGKVLADWLRISPAEARRRARVTEPLTERTTLTGERLAPAQPAAAEAWRAGALDSEHLRVIQRFLADLPFDVTDAEREKAEAFLAEQARLLRPDQLAKVADRLAVTLNPDGTFSEEDRARRRGFTWAPQRTDGVSVGKLVATPELRSMLEAWFAKFAGFGMCNPADQTAVVDGEPVQAEADADTRSLGQRQHDALAALVRGQLGDPKLGQHNGLPVTVIVSATLQQLQDKTGHAVTAGGTLLPIPDVIRMARHAYHYLALFDGATGRALWLGRTKRIASADQRIVLHANDIRDNSLIESGYACRHLHPDFPRSDRRGVGRPTPVGRLPCPGRTDGLGRGHPLRRQRHLGSIAGWTWLRRSRRLTISSIGCACRLRSDCWMGRWHGFSSWCTPTFRHPSLRPRLRRGGQRCGGGIPMPRDEGGDRRSLRDDVIRLYEKRLPQGRLEPNAGIWCRGHMHRQLERLQAGETVQLHRFGEVDRLPLAYWPARTELWTLAELRDGDVLVPVPSWRPGAPLPADWAV